MMMQLYQVQSLISLCSSCPAHSCPYLHRTSGDTERRYHLRYYKTGICVYDTDTRGYCVKNGQHCAFAHGIHDLRSPVYDIRELQAMDGGGLGDGVGLGGNGVGDGSLNGPNNLDKERNALNEDPRWNDSAYVLANYKTDLCKRPPRLCRQGYACPQYHNVKDKRRSPKKLKYRSTPCPNVKAGDEWGDPSNCEAGDNCAYCHTRTEQQFHPEIYKSTKCNDVLQTAYCPRGPFCAFAHGDKEMQSRHELMNDDVELKNFIPPLNGNSNGTGGNGGNGGNNNSHISPSNAVSMANSSGRSHSKSVSIASSLPDHYPIHSGIGGMTGMNNLLNSNSNNAKNNGSDNNAFSSQTPAQHGTGAMSIGDRGLGFSLGPIGTRPRSYSTSQANPASCNSFDIFEQMLGRGHTTHSDQGSLLNGGDMRSAALRRPTGGMFDAAQSALYPRNHFGSAASDLVSSSSRARATISDNFNNADTVVGSVVESAIGEIDLSLDDLDVPFESLSRTNASALVNGNTDTLIEHHHPSQQNSFLSSSAGVSNPAAIPAVADAGLSMPGSAPVNIPGRMNTDRSLNLNSSPPISASPITSSLGHSLGPFGLSPFRQQHATQTTQQNALSNHSSIPSANVMSEPCLLFRKMFFPRFTLFLTFNRFLYFPETLSDVGESMILNETYRKFELKWKEVLRENWGPKDVSGWMNSNFSVLKDFAMTIFTRYSREIMIDRSGKEVVDDDFMDQLLNSRSLSGINTSSGHMM